MVDVCLHKTSLLAPCPDPTQSTAHKLNKFTTTYIQTQNQSTDTRKPVSTAAPTYHHRKLYLGTLQEMWKFAGCIFCATVNLRHSKAAIQGVSL